MATKKAPKKPPMYVATTPFSMVKAARAAQPPIKAAPAKAVVPPATSSVRAVQPGVVPKPAPVPMAQTSPRSVPIPEPTVRPMPEPMSPAPAYEPEPIMEWPTDIQAPQVTGEPTTPFRRGGFVKKADGIAKRGKTKGRYI